MSESRSLSGAGTDVINGCLVVSLPGNIDSRSLSGAGRELLCYVRDNRIRRVIINVSAIQVMDSCGFTILSNTARAITMLGGNTVFVGFQPGVAASLVDLDMNLDEIHTAVHAEDAFELLLSRESPLKQDKGKAGEDSAKEPSDDAMEP